MFSPFHILKVQSDGSLRWTEGAPNVECAKARVKDLALSSRGEYVVTNLTGRQISIKAPLKRVLFQIGYDERELTARAELFRRCGHEVISAADNEAAKRTLRSIHSVDVFVVGHEAPETTRKEMVDWLKANFPKVRVVALAPPANQQLSQADSNAVLNGLEELSSLLAVATG